MLFTLSGLLKLLDATVLNPAVSAAFLASAIYAESIPLSADSSQLLQTCSDILQHNSTLVKGVSQALILGLFLRVNRYFSQRALNNGVSAKFDWDKEIIVVTGGSYGIGAATVQRLATRGSTLIVLDVKEPSYSTCMSSGRISSCVSMLTASEKRTIYIFTVAIYRSSGKWKMWLMKSESMTFIRQITRNGLTSISRRFGDPTCVVANAGVYRKKSILEASEQDITS